MSEQQNTEKTTESEKTTEKTTEVERPAEPESGKASERVENKAV